MLERKQTCTIWKYTIKCQFPIFPPLLGINPKHVPLSIPNTDLETRQHACLLAADRPSDRTTSIVRSQERSGRRFLPRMDNSFLVGVGMNVDNLTGKWRSLEIYQ